MISQAEVQDRSLRLLDYLSALAAQLSGMPVRQLSSYGPHLDPSSIPGHQAVRLGPSDTRSAWLSVGRVADIPTPELPSELLGWTTSEPITPDTPPTLDAQALDTASDDAADPYPDAVRAGLDHWTTTVWAPWSARATVVRAARALYQRLYDLRLQAEEDDASHELVWGHGVLSWVVSGQRIQHPLLLTPVSIDLDVDTGTLLVQPTGDSSLEFGCLQQLDVPELEELARLARKVKELPPDPWVPGALAGLYEQVVGRLGLDAVVLPDPVLPAPGPTPVISDTWAVFRRSRPVLYERFYRELKDVLAERGEVSPAVAAVVAERDKLDGEAAHALGLTSTSRVQSLLGDRLLLPLPSNEAQERVARALAYAPGVTVQGPPGTGKTHTIANLISHLVAHGKRVLVTAHSEQALGVLRDKIPEDLRDLSVAVLGAGQGDLREMQASAQNMLDAVASIDVQTETVTVQNLVKQLDQARLRERTLELRVVQLLQDEEAEFELPSGPARAVDVARWLADTEVASARIPDPIPVNAACPWSADDYRQLLQLAAGIAPEDAVAALQVVPEGVPTADDLSATFRMLDELRDRLADLERLSVSLTHADALGTDGLAALQLELEDLAGKLDRWDNGWVLRLREQMRQGPALVQLWRDQVERLEQAVAETFRLDSAIFGHQVVLPRGEAHHHLRFLDELAARFEQGKGVPRLSARDLRDFHQALRVNGQQVRTVEDVALARTQCEAWLARAALGRQYGGFEQQLGLPSLDAAAPNSPVMVQGIVLDLRAALDWESSRHHDVTGRVRLLLPRFPGRPVADDARRAASTVGALAAREQERRISEQLDDLRSRLAQGQIAGDASPLWSSMSGALERRDLTTWTTSLSEARRLQELRPDLDRRDELVRRGREAGAVEWVNRILGTRGDVDEVGSATDLDRLWHWRRAQTWLDQLHARGDLAELERSLAAETTQGQRLVVRLAASAARLALKGQLREDQRRALHGWLTAMRRAGKQTGKFAPAHLAEARQQLPLAMGAVPVWIMPIYRVMQTFDPRRADRFDVVIVDESSQCDVLSLGVMSLGKQVIVVGDDRQTSPQAVGVDQGRVAELIRTHLDGVPQAGQLDAQASLYDIATRAFPDVVLLREHFRCVTDIIGFSNHRYYDGKILPLREDPQLGIAPAVRPVKVLNGARTKNQRGDVNVPEAEALVRQVQACARDPHYDGLTFGVVTMIGVGQGPLIRHLLLEALGQQEFELRRLRVGSAANFQGDERNVVFISVVADDARSAATGLAAHQRVNVAASRAQDQMWVFHTVDPGILKPDDAHGQLITYAYGASQDPEQVASLIALCESPFEEAVLGELLRRGYRVHPQYKVGHYRIDLVVQGQDDRLAVECDGDQYHGEAQYEADLRRQRVLERQKWKFWRVRGSAFYRHPGEALESLWRRLDELGIRPQVEWTVRETPARATEVVTRVAETSPVETDGGETPMMNGVNEADTNPPGTRTTGMPTSGTRTTTRLTATSRGRNSPGPPATVEPPEPELEPARQALLETVHLGLRQAVAGAQVGGTVEVTGPVAASPSRAAVDADEPASIPTDERLRVAVENFTSVCRELLQQAGLDGVQTTATTAAREEIAALEPLFKRLRRPDLPALPVLAAYADEVDAAAARLRLHVGPS